MRERYIKYGSAILLGIIIILTYLIISPFVSAIVGSAIIAYIFYPLYKIVYRYVKRKSVSSVLMIVIVFLIVFLPIVFILNSLVREIPSVYAKIVTSDIMIIDRIEQDFQKIGLNIEVSKIVESLTNSLLNNVRQTLTSLPGKLINTAMAAFFLFFFFRDGRLILDKLLHFVPFHKKDAIIIIRELKQMMDAVIFGQLITAIIQAILATIGYWILGISAPLFWGVVTLMFSLIPMIGPTIVYIPLALSLLARGIFSAESFLVLRGVILLIYGFTIISTVDNIVKPLVISDKVKMHPALVIVGVIGGLSVFGIIGIVLGPLILVFLFTIINIYEMKQGLLSKIENKRVKKENKQ